MKRNRKDAKVREVLLSSFRTQLAMVRATCV